MDEVAGGDAAGARLEHLDGAHDAPGEDETDGHRQADAEEHQDGRARDRGADRRERLGERLLDDDEPAEWLDGRGRGQHRSALQIVGDRRHVPRPRHPHVLEPGEIRLLQDEADVGMGDELAAAIDDERVAGLADADLADDVPDELEVHLGNGDRSRGAGRTAAARHRDRHVGLGLLPEVHGAEVRASRAGLRELGVIGEVRAAAHHVHGQA